MCKSMNADALKIGLLHLAPRAGDIPYNRGLIERAVKHARDLNCAWIVTPELAVCGYTFANEIGTDWILAQPDPWMRKMMHLAAELKVCLFLSVPERDPIDNRLHNSVFVIDRHGNIAGRHRKINTLRVGSEAWSSPGDELQPIPLGERWRIGVMVCADAYSPHIPLELSGKGANVLVSPAAWPPGLHGPKGEWERSTTDTGLTLFVCNRTGADAVVDFTPGESVVALAGKRVFSASSKSSTAFTFTWNCGSTQHVIDECRNTKLE
jgi:5-aminopentanamidase